MPMTRSAAQQAASRHNGARSHGPVTAAGKARSARNGTRHGLRGGPFALLPGEDRDELADLHAAVTSDWGPRDAYERRWVMELVTSMWRQDRLRGLELATLTAAAAESPPSEATVRRLGTYARYGARIDKDIGRALQALRVLRRRPDEWLEEERGGTSEPGEPDAATPNFTNELSPCTFEPENPEPQEEKYTNELARTLEPDAANGNVEPCTAEPEPPALNRHQRRRLAALARRRRAA
ncbi:MAG: hypothetical protein AB7I59_02865 [Geminicoccaceae bacterium]